MRVDSGQRVEFFSDKIPLKPLAMAFGLVAMSAFLIVVAPNRAFGIVIGVIGLAFFGPLFIYMVYRAVVRRPLVVLTPEGLVDQSTLAAVGLIPWSEIVDLKVYPFMNQRFLGIFVKDPDVVLKDRSPFVRWIAGRNRSLVPTPFNIAGPLLPLPIDDLHAQILAYRSKMSGKPFSA